MPTASSIAEQIRDLARSVLMELGAQADGKLRETTLIRHGNYCGHRYRLGTVEAVWFIEEDELKFSSASGGTLRTMVASEALSTLQHQRRQKRAA